MDSVLSTLHPFINAATRSHWWDNDLARVTLSFGLIFVVLTWLAIIYRGGAGDEEIEKPVTLALLNASEEHTLILAPRHLKEGSTHDTKAPRVEFFLQVPNCAKYDYQALVRPLRLSIRGRNSSSVYDHEYARDVPGREYARSAAGGQLGIDSETRNLIEKYFAEIFRKEGRRFDVDTATFVIRLRYPASLNLTYLLKEHPDASVRVGAWIFILTSVFSIVQELIFRR